jgi:hypothetical protein
MREERLETGYSWETGLLREINEDSILCTSFELRTHLGSISAGLFAVADGMGGHSAGEIASDLATRTLHAECISGLLAQSPAPPLSILASAFEKANSNVLDSASDSELKGMGTTLTAALVIGGVLCNQHTGDHPGHQGPLCSPTACRCRDYHIGTSQESPPQERDNTRAWLLPEHCPGPLSCKTIRR